MLSLRILLATILAVIAIYTVVVVANHGLGLLPIFFGDIAAMTWPGQFNLDFLGFLVLSGTWLAWRHDFSPGGLLLGVCGLFGGAPLPSRCKAGIGVLIVVPQLPPVIGVLDGVLQGEGQRRGLLVELHIWDQGRDL